MRFGAHNILVILSVIPTLVTADEGGTRTLVISLSAGPDGRLIPFVMPAANERGDPVGPPAPTISAPSPSDTNVAPPSASNADTVIVINTTEASADSASSGSIAENSSSATATDAPAESSPSADAPSADATDSPASDAPADSTAPAEASDASAKPESEDLGSGSDSDDESAASNSAEGNATSKKSAAAHVSPTDMHSLLAIVASGMVMAYGWM